jgi:hypothetical protein
MALLPAQDVGETVHRRAIRWLVGQTPANATYLYRLRTWLGGNALGEEHAGFSWVPGTAGWSTPTALAVLALARENRHHPDAVLMNRIASARAFLMQHRCRDWGWNHGSVRALGVDVLSYPETTGTVLLAMAGVSPALDAALIEPSISRAEAWWAECPSCEAMNWLALGLRAAGRAKESAPKTFTPRTVMDAALQSIAGAGARGMEVFLG